MKIRYTLGARTQLADISRYIRQRNPAAAPQVGQRLRGVVALLAERPTLGAPGRVPHITYRVAEDGSGSPVLEVLRLHHEARSETAPDWD